MYKQNSRVFLMLAITMFILLSNGARFVKIVVRLSYRAIVEPNDVYLLLLF